MRWIKKGLIFNVHDNYDWMAHHAAVPIADKVDDNILRIYFGPRDREGRTTTTFIEVEAANPANVLYVHDRPVLGLGRRGAFDDSGAMPSCIVNHEGKKYLFYIGWTPRVTVPYHVAIGLAVSEDGGRTFQRIGEGPILDRNAAEPYFCTVPFVLIDEGKWKLWYASGDGWTVIDDHPEPLYHIAYAESTDGLNWNRNDSARLNQILDREADARPFVLKRDGGYQMWFCYRGSVSYRTDSAQSYRLGYAESLDGIEWTRRDAEVGIDRSDEGWDSQMMAYPYVYEHRGRTYLLYNGNGFGETGFGYAVLEEE
jgi:hypothetical protein